MSQQLTLATTNHQPMSYLWTLHSVPFTTSTTPSSMIPNFVIIKLCDHHFKVASTLLCQSSRYFDALIRFKTSWDPSYGTRPITPTTTPITASTTQTFHKDGIIIDEIEIIEKKQDAFKNILYRLSNAITETGTATGIHSTAPAAPSNNCFQQQKYQTASNDSLDFLFDCILLCSKYFFDYLERFYSDEFVRKLRLEAMEFAVNDVIFPPNHSDDNDNDGSDWLTMIDIYRLAKVYNLDYLSMEIQDLIREKRALFLRRLRNTYYFW